MSSDPRLAALPALRKLAEEEARDIWTRHVRLFRAWEGTVRFVEDPDDAPEGFAVTVEAQVERLADLSRPASRDAVARLIAGRLGLECGVTAPGFGMNVNRDLILGTPDDYRCFIGAGHIAGTREVAVPGISTITDPTEALTLVALQVLA